MVSPQGRAAAKPLRRRAPHGHDQPQGDVAFFNLFSKFRLAAGPVDDYAICDATSNPLATATVALASQEKADLRPPQVKKK